MPPEILDPDTPKLTLYILGRRVTVPAGDLLLRCFQFLYGNRISMGRFCWNNECGNCEVRCVLPGQTREQTIRACMYESREGLRITQVPIEFRVIMQARPPDADQERGTAAEEPTADGEVVTG